MTSKVRVRLGLGLRVKDRVKVFADVYYKISYVIIIIQSNCIGMDCSHKLQSSRKLTVAVNTKSSAN